jgi:predicted permease
MRLYRLLLHLFPTAFRNEYGDEMCWIFEKRLRDASSFPSRLTLWVATIWEIFTNAMSVHWDIFRQDFRYTVRTLRRNPGFTLAAILVAALGVGATTGAFSITDHVLIRPLPFADSNRLVKLWESPPGYTRNELSPPNYFDWKHMSHSFETMGTFTFASTNLTGQGEPERVQGILASSEVLPMLGVQPILGRLFTSQDDRAEAPATLVLSYGLWQRRFNSDANVLGKKVLLDNEPYEIIGVMPRSFYFPTRKDDDFWAPIRFTPGADFEDRNNHYLQAIAKLKKNVSLDEAKADMQVVASQLAQKYPEANERTTANVMLLRDELSRQTRYLLIGLVCASMCVLLIACSNLANLLLARAMGRRKELAVRSALGAGRERLVRQLLTESLMLSVLGGLLGICLTILAMPLLVRLVPNSLPIAETPSIDMRVMIFALIATAITGIGFGMIPALKSSEGTDAHALNEGSRSGVGGRRERLRSAMIIAEVSASVLLLISAGLLLRALLRIQAVDPGFNYENVLTMRTWLPIPKYGSTAKRAEFYRRVLSETRSLPGVKNAAYITGLPMVMRGGIWPIEIAGKIWERSEEHNASLRYVTPGYFGTLQIPLIEGRDVSESDTQDSMPVAVVSKSFVEQYFPGQNALGHKFKVAIGERTIVGIVGDVRARGLEITSEAQVYLPNQQVPDGAIIFYTPKDLVIRTSSNPLSMMPAVRQIIKNADPEQPISDVQLLSDIVESETAPRGTQLRVIGVFAGIAILLAGIGIHGLLSYAVSQRTQEFGVRIALGAQSSEILKMVLRDGVILAATGIVVGAGLAFAAGKTMEALLAGVKPADPITFLIAIAVALIMTIAGSLLPAKRAVSVDPTIALRTE